MLKKYDSFGLTISVFKITTKKLIANKFQCSDLKNHLSLNATK